MTSLPDSLRALLGHVVDYAGLFPPASVDMVSAFRNYAAYREGDEAWMLGRFILPAAGLSEFAQIWESTGAERGAAWPLSVVLGGEFDAGINTVRALQASGVGATVESLEVKASRPEEARRACALLRPEFELFVEIPLASDQEETEQFLTILRGAGAKAKLRTGGVIPSAVPSVESVARAIKACVDAGVPFKATAGLHHPLRAEYRMTYSADAPVGTMFGYLNVFLASALVRRGLSAAELTALLGERDPSAFQFGADVIRWRGHSLHTDDIREARCDVALSFGSCSFREPVDELALLVNSP